MIRMVHPVVSLWIGSYSHQTVFVDANTRHKMRQDNNFCEQLLQRKTMARNNELIEDRLNK